MAEKDRLKDDVASVADAALERFPTLARIGAMRPAFRDWFKETRNLIEQARSDDLTAQQREALAKRLESIVHIFQAGYTLAEHEHPRSARPADTPAERTPAAQCQLAWDRCFEKTERDLAADRARNGPDAAEEEFIVTRALTCTIAYAACLADCIMADEQLVDPD